MSVYVLPRATKDIDFVVELKMQDVEKLAERFSDGYYLDKDSVEESVRKKGMFNIIDHATGFKADFFLLSSQRFEQIKFSRRQQTEFFEQFVYIISPEDLLISKLVWIQQLQSAVQIEDIKSLLAVEQLDRAYIQNWVQELNLFTFGLQL